jgi:cytochrome P450
MPVARQVSSMAGREATIPSNYVPPGPKPHWLVGSLPEFRRDPLEFLTHCVRTYGDTVSFRILRVPVYLLTRPDHIEIVLSTNSGSFIKGRLIRASLLFGKGLFASDGAAWARLRKLNQPAFRRDRVTAYARATQDCARRMVGRWRDGDTFDIHAAMNELTVQIVSRALFGLDVEAYSAEVGACMHTVLEHFRAQVDTGLLIPQSFPTPGNLRMKRALARLEGIVHRIIRERRTSGRRTDDLLSSLLQPGDSGACLTDGELCDEVKTLLVIGNDTTAVTLTWMCYLLSQHPAVEERLASEIAAVIGDRPVTLEDVPRLMYASRILLESLRLYPPAWSIPRVAVEDCKIGELTVARGTSITVPLWVIHRDPRHFAEPDMFDPDRWADGFRERLPAFAYFPFGSGPRGCMGESFAMVEALLILVMIAQRFRLRRVDPEPVLPWPTLTLQPRGAVRMRLEQRDHSIAK